MLGFAGMHDGAAVLFETDAGISGETLRIGMESSQEGRDFSTYIFVARWSLVC